jgi:uncharacterized RDD family membrane protein YckC
MFSEVEEEEDPELLESLRNLGKFVRGLEQAPKPSPSLGGIPESELSEDQKRLKRFNEWLEKHGDEDEIAHAQAQAPVDRSYLSTIRDALIETPRRAIDSNNWTALFVLVPVALVLSWRKLPKFLAARTNRDQTTGKHGLKVENPDETSPSMRIHVKPHNQDPKELTLDSINAMLASGELDGREIAWTPGMSEWAMLELIPGIVRPQPPPLPATPTPAPIQITEPSHSIPAPAPEKPTENQFLPDRFDPSQLTAWRRFFLAAHPQSWRRFWARLIDVGIARICLEFVGLFVLLTTGLWPPYESHPFVAFIGSFIAWVLFLMLYEACMLSFFGTTIGKLIFQIRITLHDGSLLSFGKAFARTNHAIGSGMFYLIAFPGLTFWAFYRAYRNLVASGQSAWDSDTGSVVRCRPVFVLLYAFGVIFSLITLLGYIGVREHTKQEFLRVMIQNKKPPLKLDGFIGR